MKLGEYFTFVIFLSHSLFQAKEFKAQVVDEVNRIPTVVYGSDDEILTPLYENDYLSGTGLKGDTKELFEESSKKFERNILMEHIPFKNYNGNENVNDESMHNVESYYKIFRKGKTQLHHYVASSDENSEFEINKIIDEGEFRMEPLKHEYELANSNESTELKSEANKVSVQPGGFIAAVKLETSQDVNSSSLNPFEFVNHEPGKVIFSFPNVPITEEKIGADAMAPEIDSKKEDEAKVEDDNEDDTGSEDGHEGINLNDEKINGMEYGRNYLGPRINMETEITTKYVLKQIVPYFKSGKFLDIKSAYAILYRAYQILSKEESLVEVKIEPYQKLIIFGDIHGQFHDFIKVVQEQGPPSNTLKYIFNGDIVDRGKNSVECLLTLLAFKIAEPDSFFIGLGNHETLSVGRLQFHRETVKKYGSEEFFMISHSVFRSLPVAFLVQKEIFVTHGGIRPNLTLDRIREINRLNPNEEDEDIINDLTWSDPMPNSGVQLSNRGLGYLYGPDVTKDFIFRNDISLIIRSHQFKEFGFSEEHDGFCITIFSCPNYRGKMRNYGAFMTLDNSLIMSFHLFKASRSTKELTPVPSSMVLARSAKRLR